MGDQYDAIILGTGAGAAWKSWSLAQARASAAEIRGDKPAMRALIADLFGDDRVRKRAADVARRITEWVGGVLEKYSDELAGLLRYCLLRSRGRGGTWGSWSRGSRTRRSSECAARVMLTLAEDESNVVRCSAVEGLGTLALGEPSLFEDAKAMVETFLRIGTTLAMKSRARGVRTMRVRRYAERV